MMRSLPNPDEVLAKAGLDCRAYFSVLAWPHTQAVVETRRLNALSREIIIRPSDQSDATSKEAADYVRSEFARLRIKALRSELWWAAYIGFSLALLEWEEADIGYRVKRWAVAPQHLVRLGFDTSPVVAGTELPWERCVLCRSGGASAFDLYGRGCAQGAYWPSFFLIADWKYWGDDVERYAAPRVLALVPPGYASTGPGLKYIDKVLGALDGLVRGGTAALDADTGLKIQELAHHAPQTSRVHQEFQRAGDELISKAVLGQTLSTDGGTIGTGAETLGRIHAETGLLPRLEADLQMIDEGLQWLAELVCRYRYGRDDLTPVIDHAGPRIRSGELSTIVNDLGLPVSQADAYDILGVPAPESGAPLLAGRLPGVGSISGQQAPRGSLGFGELSDGAGDHLTPLEQKWGPRLIDEYRKMGEAMTRTVSALPWEPKLSEGRQRVLAKVLRDMLLDAWLTAVEKALTKARDRGVELADPDVELDVELMLPIENREAKRILAAKQVVSTIEARARGIEQYAFSIARVEDMRLVEFAKGEVQRAAQGEVSLPEFRRSLETAFQEAGASPIRAGHAETVLRTNLASAYEGGHYEAVMSPALAEVFPAFEFKTVGDARVRAEHEILDGIVFGRDDPRLGEYWPPLDYNCRCTMLELAPEELPDGGIAEPVLDWHPPESFRDRPGAFM